MQEITHGPNVAKFQEITVQGWPLAITPGDEEPRVRDLDLAERLVWRVETVRAQARGAS